MRSKTELNCRQKFFKLPCHHYTIAPLLIFWVKCGLRSRLLQIHSLVCCRLHQIHHFVRPEGFEPSIPQSGKNRVPYTLVSPSGDYHESFLYARWATIPRPQLKRLLLIQLSYERIKINFKISKSKKKTRTIFRCSGLLSICVIVYFLPVPVSLNIEMPNHPCDHL